MVAVNNPRKNFSGDDGKSPDEKDSLIQTLSQLLELEKVSRNAATIDALRFIIVNRSYELLTFDRSAVLENTLRGIKVTAISNVPIVQADSPFVLFLNDFVKKLHKTGRIGEALFLDSQEADKETLDSWSNLAPRYMLLLPIAKSDTKAGAWLALFRNKSWQQHEAVLFSHILETYAHAMAKFQKKSRTILPKDKWQRYFIYSAAMLAVVGIMFIKVSQFVLAPARIVANNPTYISSPIDGTVRDILIDPNSEVKKGDPLLIFEDTELRNAASIAQKSYEVVEANLRRVSQGAFNDLQNKEEISLLKAQLNKSEAEKRLALERLERTTIYSPSSGFAIFRDKNDLVGVPIKVGQRILLIADSKDIELSIDLPIGEVIPLELGSDVRLFLDSNPLKPIDAKLSYHAYQANINDNQKPSYLLKADIDYSDITRIGARGTARIKGSSVSLFFYIFRKPISWLRQTLGV